VNGPPGALARHDTMKRRESIMKLGFFTMPMHPPGRDYTQTLKEDREAVLLADRLGYCEAFIGEHVTDVCESIPSCLTFIASLAHETRQITLGSGTVNLPNNHPAQVAAHVAMVDHLLEGRFLFGIGPGGLRSDWEALGTLDRDRNAMFVEAINHIIALWQGDAPYKLEGQYWNISTERTLIREAGQGVMVKPYQKPHPPIVVTVVVPHSKGLVAAAKRGWTPISANFLQPVWAATHWPMYERGCAESGRQALKRDWRVCKSIFVADDDATAQRYAKDAHGPYGFYYWNLLTKRRAQGSVDIFKHDPTLGDDAITVEYLLDKLVIAGSVSSVVDQLLSFRETVGEFGTLLYCGHDWADPALARRSMELMAEKVLPAINGAERL
jgi:alkanesulfonate monooxygenase SsuD/methylene tetrahydromethanopterin reductase-like flavin-dependent oxidoreductase (luciferase family)